MSRRGEQLLTTVLAGLCAVLFVLSLLFQFGVGAGYSWESGDSDDSSGVAANAIDSATFKLPPESDFAVIHERPLFNEDRKPAPDEPVEAVPDAPPPAPLNINLTGTIHSPGAIIAMVQERGKPASIALKEGMPLPGELGAWTLTKVKPRSAIFKSTAGEEIEVELTVSAGSPKTAGPHQRGSAPPPGTTTTASTSGPPPNGMQPPKPGAGANQSEDLQRRIEERRRQMRDAAEKNRKNPPPPQPQSQ